MTAQHPVAGQRITPTHIATASGAIVGLAQWAISTYAFNGHEPAPVSTAVFVLLPMILGGVTAFYTRRSAKLPEPPSDGPAPAAAAAGG